MIQYKLTIESDLLERLNALDESVKSAVKVGVHKTAEEAYNNILAKADQYDWNPPRTTGNLKQTTGYLVQGGGKYNISNYNISRRHASAVDAFPLPPAPSNPYSAVVFTLASYAAYQEFGTTRHGAKPFFYSSVLDAWSKIEINISTELMVKMFTSRSSSRFGYGYHT